eukprot:TRINITY_DN19198_c0_g1_i1.p1 TRINITY_DN19198_c0_g1~~TRINITY_DN19198_c0_g1_i1.p1  ORF type:complete len:382 (+),score=126.70 TRINITY_DN19198_c0_g1_i1:324-1469(+)
MIGPTGVGKTEIARRLAKIQNAPFIKVEATKFTEVGFHGRDVDQIIRDLVDIAVIATKDKLKKRYAARLKETVNRKIVEILVGSKNPDGQRIWREKLENGELENQIIEFEAPPNQPDAAPQKPFGGGGEAFKFQLAIPADLFGGLQFRSKKKMTISEARPVFEQMELDKLISLDKVHRRAITSVEQSGIVFIDEIDKICNPAGQSHGPDASAEGVQRDLLPLIEGTTISTRIGNVDTSKILFIASGAFHSVKPSDLMPELQGRLPIRVELKGLGQQDLYRILTEPQVNMIKQQIELMRTENFNLRFTDKAVMEIARVASEVNDTVENIGARRLHTVVERIVEDYSYNCDRFHGQEVVITEQYIKEHLGDMLLKTDLSKFIL